MLGKVGYQVSQVKDQFGQGQGQELDKIRQYEVFTENMNKVKDQIHRPY